MIEQLKKQFTQIKSDIDELKIRSMSDQRQRQNLQKQIDELKIKIKEQFGVDVQFFEKEISNIQESLMQKKQNLKKKILQAKEKIK